MTNKSALSFKITFVAITLLTILGDVMHIPWLHYVCKPLIMGLLLFYVWQRRHSYTYPDSTRWLIAGMGFALAGDVFLMIQEADLFAPGLGAFLLMQLCYCVAFVKAIHQGGHSIQLQSILAKALPFLIYVVGFLAVLRPVFVQTPALSALWWPVVIYAICLGTMGLLAAQRQNLPHYVQVIVGALLFIFSDSVIAINKFLTALPGAPWLIISTYATAQYLIVAGTVCQRKLANA